MKTNSAQAHLLESPPGYGKSFVLQSIYARKKLLRNAVVWVTLDADDCQLPDFLRHLQLALGISLDMRLNWPFPATPDASARILAGALSASNASIDVFLDGLECCQDTRLSIFLDRLISILPPHVRLWMSTKRRIDFDAERFISSGRLAILGIKELAFTKEEVCAFLGRKAKGDWQKNTYVRAWEITQGWPFALATLARLLEQNTASEQTVESFSGSDRAITHFLHRQLRERIQPETYALLLRIAPFDELTLELCRAVNRNPHDVENLDDAERLQCFLQVRDHNPCIYVLHPMIRQFLNSDAERCGHSQEQSQALVKAASWYLRQNNFALAADCALKSRNADYISEFLNLVAPICVSQHDFLHVFIGWCECAQKMNICLNADTEYWYRRALLFVRHSAGTQWNAEFPENVPQLKFQMLRPEDITTQRRMEELRIMIKYFAGHHAEAAHDARRWLANRMGANTTSTISLACVVAIHSILQFDFAEAREMLRLAREQNLVERSESGGAWISVLNAQIDMFEGEFPRARQTLELALARVSNALGENAIIPSSVKQVLGLALLEMGEYEQARILLRFGIGHLTLFGAGEAAYSCVEAALELWDGSAECAFAPARIESLIDTYPGALQNFFYALLTQRLLRLGREREARVYAEKIGMDFDHPLLCPAADSACQEEVLHIIALEILIYEGAIRPAEQLAEQLRKAARSTKRRGREIRMEVTLAILAQRQNMHRNAIRHLSKAIQLAAPRHIRHPFLSRIDALQPLLKAAEKQDWGFVHAEEWAILDLMYKSAGMDASLQFQMDAGSLRVDLTRQELHVMRLAAQGLTNQQIADRTQTSITTVKWHFTNIFEKLQVRNRTAASAKLRDLNLIQ